MSNAQIHKLPDEVRVVGLKETQLERAYIEARKTQILTTVLGHVAENASGAKLDLVHEMMSGQSRKTNSGMNDYVRARANLTPERKAALSERAFEELKMEIGERHIDVKKKLHDMTAQLEETKGD